MNSIATVSSLQRRISEMQPLRLDERALPTAPGLRPLLPGGALRRGGSYAVQGSWQLALAFLSEASESGSWCGVIGGESFGAEAAADLGVALDRCAIVPRPGRYAAGIAGSLAEVLTVVLLASPGPVPPGEAERIAARLREHGSVLIVVGDWPRADAELRVTASRWSGLGRGHGLLEGRELTVQSRDRRGVQNHTVRFAGGRVLDPRQAAVHRLVPR